MIRIAIVIAAGLAFATTLPNVPVHAAARDRVFVASYGSDSNPCTFLSPCKTFQNAYDTVAAGGEITAIDSAGFGPLSISKSITVTSPPGVEAGIVPSAGGDAVDISATSDIDVTLRGLTLEGGGSGLRGVFLTSTVSNTATLTILDCLVKDFTASGISIQPASGQNAALDIFIGNTSSLKNASDGIKIAPTGTVAVVGTMSQVAVVNNQSNGFEIDGNANITITNSVASTNANYGINLQHGSTVTMRDSTINYNDFGIEDLSANGAFANLYHNNTVVVAYISNGGVITSDGTNVVFNLYGGMLTVTGTQ